ncbi:hypothetical protein AB0N77_27175 [Streptomyces misionensis]|uniref:hypothetical protein n=1 Tax=Streptomyces misionensis TaxID=67331 RepID=UPI00342D7D5B
MTATDAARVTTVRQRRTFVLPGSVQGTPISTLAAITVPLPVLRATFPHPTAYGRAMATWGGLSVPGATAGTGEGDPARGEHGTRQVERPSPARHGARRQPGGGEGEGPEGHHERYRERPTPGHRRRDDAATPGPSPRRRPSSASSPS